MAVTDVKQWKKRDTNQPHELTVPSGNVCLAIRPGLKVFVEQGRVPNRVLPIITAALEGTFKAKDISEIKEDQATLEEVEQFMAMVVIETVVQPIISPVPPKGKKRREDCLYIDEVDGQDISFIFNWAVGGSADLERFHRQQEELLAALQDEQQVRSPSKRASRTKSKRK